MPTYKIVAYYVLGGHSKIVNSDELGSAVIEAIKLSPVGKVEVTLMYKENK